MNSISELWEGINSAILAQKTEIGITSVESAETGTLNLIKAPGVATWMDFGEPTFAGGRQLISLPVDLFVFCVAAPQKNQSAAVDAALEIGIKVLEALSQTSIAGSIILPADKPLELIEKSSSKAVVAAMFTIDVRL